MSYHRLSVKPLNVTLNTLLKRAVHVGLGVGAFTPILALANPTGGQVVAGQATIATPNANGLVINQASQSAIINWQQFSIGKGQYVQFLQPSSSSVVLNRVVGGNASSILGSLTANGQVFLVNPNGIFFGKSASLDVQGIVASTLDIANSDFLSGNYVFDKGSSSVDASVVNQGTISTHNGGYVVLAGDYSENDGIIQARSGHVVLASGAKTTLTLSGNSLVNFAVNSATLAKFVTVGTKQLAAGTDNTGSLIADGGTVVMTADVANQLKATVVNNTGLIEAHAISKNNGAIYLTAIGGNLVNAGTLDADAGHAAQAGGAIVLKADGLTDLTNTSKNTATGNGADGGSLEVSGNTLSVRGTATLGLGGNMLLDPTKMKLVTGSVDNVGTGANTAAGLSGSIGITFIQNALKVGTNVAISAHNLISHSVNAAKITATGTGNLSFKVGTGGLISLSGVTISIGGNLNASGCQCRHELRAHHRQEHRHQCRCRRQRAPDSGGSGRRRGQALCHGHRRRHHHQRRAHQCFEQRQPEPQGHRQHRCGWQRRQSHRQRGHARRQRHHRQQDQVHHGERVAHRQDLRVQHRLPGLQCLRP